MKPESGKQKPKSPQTTGTPKKVRATDYAQERDLRNQAHNETLGGARTDGTRMRG